jgi:hypothetical protein
MTAKQKAAREKFKKVVAEAGKLRKKNPKLTQAQAVKQAWAMSYSKAGVVKKKSAPKKVAAIKIIEKGETKSAKAKATYQQVRTKKGTFKGLKKVAGVQKKYTKKQLEKIASDYAYVTGGDLDKLTYRLLDKDYTEKLLPVYLEKISDFEKKYKMKISGIKKKVSTGPKKKSAASKRITDIHKDSKSHNVNIRVVSGLPSYKDPDMARELELYADNDSLLYFQRRKPILINLSKKYKKGTYDIQKAAKLWRYYIDAALEKYNKEFGSRGDKWYDLMSVPDRNLLALEYAQNTKEEFDLGNFTEK